MKNESFKINSNNQYITGTITIPDSDKDHQNAIIICHGIPSMEGKDLTVEEKGYLEISNLFSKNGFISIVFNFQGCKGSTGKYSPFNWIENLNSIINYIHKKKEILNTFVLSFSGGAMISVKTVANNAKVDFLIACACPSDLYRDHYFINILTDGLLISFQEQNLDKNRIFKELEQINPLKWIDKVSPREILILYGKKDELISPEHSEKLFNQAKEPKNIHFFENLGHKLRRERIVIDFVLNWCLEKIT